MRKVLLILSMCLLWLGCVGPSDDGGDWEVDEPEVDDSSRNPWPAPPPPPLGDVVSSAAIPTYPISPPPPAFGPSNCYCTIDSYWCCRYDWAGVWWLDCQYSGCTYHCGGGGCGG